MPEACHTFLAKQVDDIKTVCQAGRDDNTPLDPQEMWASGKELPTCFGAHSGET